VTPACIGEPVSWLRLERYAIGDLAAPAARAVEDHVGTCAACRECLDQIRGDEIALPALPAVTPRAPWWRRRWTWAIGAGALAAAAAVIFLIVRPRDRVVVDDDRPIGPTIRIKGGELVVGLVRERAGAIDLQPASYRDGDRFKVIATCADAPEVWADVVVYQAEKPNQPMTAFFPLSPTRLACGNRVPVPGAFRLTGTGAVSICLAVDADRPPPRDRFDKPGPKLDGIGCIQLRSE
jgi:hypothetical protein